MLRFSRNHRVLNRVARKCLNSGKYSHSTVDKLASIVGKEFVLAHPMDDISKYTTDWTKRYHGGNIVVRPSTTTEVADILKLCHIERLSVVPQGGNTGLVGGQIGIKENEIILSLERMNNILSVDPVSAVAIVEAGCVLEQINKQVEKAGFTMPLDLSSKGSCQIGGNIATNAGGMRVLRYGSLHQNVLGLEVVQANGEVLNMLKTLHKDNAGYHLLNLFIGSEGTLGVITKIAIQLKPLPQSVQVALVKLKDFRYVPDFLGYIKSQLNEIVSAVEFMDSNSLHAVQRDAPSALNKIAAGSPSFTLASPSESQSRSSSPAVSPPYISDVIAGGIPVVSEDTATATTPPPSSKLTPSPVLQHLVDEVNKEYRHLSDELKRGIVGEIWMLLECAGSDIENDKLRLENFLAEVLDTNIAVDAIIAQDQAQMDNLWMLREYTPVSLMHLSRRPVLTATAGATTTGAAAHTKPKVTTTPPSPQPSATSATNISVPTTTTGRLYKFDLALPVADMSEVVYEIKYQMHLFGFPCYYHATAVDGDGSCTVTTTTAATADKSQSKAKTGPTADTSSTPTTIRTVHDRIETPSLHEILMENELRATLNHSRSTLATSLEQVEHTCEERLLKALMYPYAEIDVCSFGHIGDQDLHLNVLLTFPSYSVDTKPTTAATSDTGSGNTTNVVTKVDRIMTLENIEKYKKLLQDVLEIAVHESVLKRRGSISAEHGIGQQGVHSMRRVRSEAELKMMAGIKKLMDPHNILNPGKLIPPDLLSS